MIRVININKTFNKRSRNKTKVLDSVNLEFPDTGLYAIYGKSGSGKTTLLNIIGGLDKADSGKIIINNELLSKDIDGIRNQNIGYIFQNYYLENGYTIEEILENQLLIAGFKDKNEIKKRIYEALKIVGMERFKHKNANALSGGQKQRIAIARALVKGSDILLADEPTGNLDSYNTIHIMNILKEISKKRLVILVTHEISLIVKYADSHFELVDGVLQKTNTISKDLVFEDVINESNNLKKEFDDIDYENIASFSKNQSRKNGKLFTFKKIFKANKKENDEKLFSKIFKQIFLFSLSMLLAFFSFFIYESINNKVETRVADESNIYVNLNTYNDIRKINPDLYEKVDIFNTQYLEGSFSYESISLLSGIKVPYTPKCILNSSNYDLLFGKKPDIGEILITRNLADRILKALRLDELKDSSLLLMLFEEKYRISGIIEGDYPYIYFNQVDYYNFLGVYNEIQFSDSNYLFFDKNYINNSFTSEICLTDDTNQNDNEIRIEINRNSLYKMMPDISLADYKMSYCNMVFNKTNETSTSIYILNSRPLYVQNLTMTRENFDKDIKIYVTENALDNLFIYLSPKLDSINSKTYYGIGSKYYFEMASNGESINSLHNVLKERKIEEIDVKAVITNSIENNSTDNKSTIYLIILVIVLMLFLYYFIEKSGSIKNSKDYGVYRAIGVRKGNLILKETIRTISSNFLIITISFMLMIIFMSIRYSILNQIYLIFILLSLLILISSFIILILISLIPYLFVLFKTPSEIITKYDI